MNDIFATKRSPSAEIDSGLATDGIETATRGVEPGLSRLGEGERTPRAGSHFEWNPTHAPLLFER